MPFGMSKQAGMSQCSSFVRNISLTELSHNLFSLKSSLKVAYSFEFLQQLCAGDGEERVKEKSVNIWCLPLHIHLLFKLD